MDYKAYIACVDNVPLDDWAYTAYLGFSKRGTPIKKFEFIEDVPVSKFNIIVGGYKETEQYLRELNIAVPEPLNIPEVLLPYTKRKVLKTTLKSVIDGSVNLDEFLFSWPLFIKPVHKGIFPAGFSSSPKALHAATYDLDPDTQVIISDYLDIVSEYRGFVIDGKLQALHYYIGDFEKYPDVKVIRQAISDFKDAPVGYSIDFGVTIEGETVLIECNDGYSLGAYGCDPRIYTNLISRRWRELTLKA